MCSVDKLYGCAKNNCTMSSTFVYRCQYCSSKCFVSPSQRQLNRHIRLVHSQDPLFSIHCGYKSCSRTFTNYKTYQNHMLKHKHKPSDGNNIKEGGNEIGGSSSVEEMQGEESSGVISEHSDTVSDLTLYILC